METGFKLNFNLNIYILIDFLRSNKDEGKAENLKWSLNKTIGAFVISEYILANGSQRLEIVVLFWIQMLDFKNGLLKVFLTVVHIMWFFYVIMQLKYIK